MTKDCLFEVTEPSARRHPMRAVAAAVAMALLWPAAALSQAADATQQFYTTLVDRALTTGDGQTGATAYVVEGLMWSYPVLDRLQLRFERQKTETVGDQRFDVIRGRHRATGVTRDVWFRVQPDTSQPNQTPDGGKRFDPEVDKIVRAVMTSGDGRSPDSAFVVGGRIQAEYSILKIMSMNPEMQALATIRGCQFDILTAKDIDDNEKRNVYFLLGNDMLDPGGPCRLAPERPGDKGPVK